jgi:hypothetical protein
MDAERYADRERLGRQPGASGTRLRVAREEFVSTPGHVVGPGDRLVRLNAQIPRRTGAGRACGAVPQRASERSPLC